MLQTYSLPAPAGCYATHESGRVVPVVGWYFVRDAENFVRYPVLLGGGDPSYVDWTRWRITVPGVGDGILTGIGWSFESALERPVGV